MKIKLIFKSITRIIDKEPPKKKLHHVDFELHLYGGFYHPHSRGMEREDTRRTSGRG